MLYSSTWYPNHHGISIIECYTLYHTVFKVWWHSHAGIFKQRLRGYFLPPLGKDFAPLTVNQFSQFMYYISNLYSLYFSKYLPPPPPRKSSLNNTHLHSLLHALELCLLESHTLRYPQGWCPGLRGLRQTHLGQADIAAEEVELNCGRLILEGQVTLPHDRVSPAHGNSMSIRLYCTNRITHTTLTIPSAFII